MKTIVPSAVAIGVGLIVLVGTFVPLPVLAAARLALVDVAIVLGALAVLAGVVNLLMVHSRRIEAGEKGWGYSLLTIGGLLLMLTVGAVETIRTGGPALVAPTSLSGVLFYGVVAASMASLASLVMFFLVAAAVRMLHSRPAGWSLLFLGSVLVVLLGWLPLSFLWPLDRVHQWVAAVPAAAGARGILLGTALGTFVMGIRFFTGGERPYRE